MMIFSALLPMFLANAAQASDYKLNPHKGYLLVKVFKAGALSKFAHNHVIEAKNWSGKFSFDPAAAAACKLSISVPVFDLLVDADSTRATFGSDFSNKINDSQRADIQENMFSEGQLNEMTYPSIDFKGSSCSGSGESYTLNGTFTLRGVGQDISISGTEIKVKDGKLSMKGSFWINATDYGFKPYSAAGGSIKNKDGMEIQFDIEGAAK
jgi:polyisoprenoid-binding protein YceI